MYAVIMAGGGGTRLHPLSRPERPKPFLPLLPTGETLLQATARRLPVEPGDVTVVTERRYERFVRDQLPEAKLLLLLAITSSTSNTWGVPSMSPASSSAPEATPVIVVLSQALSP